MAEKAEFTVKQNPAFPSIYYLVSAGDGRTRLATKNLHPGQRFYGEEVIHIRGEEYRVWSPYRSKIAAALLRDLHYLPIRPGIDLLYLGVGSGTTCSHLSDIVGSSGRIFGLDFAARPMRDFLENLAKRRENLFPILADAREPGSYRILVPEVDTIYCDVAQQNQTEIIIKNADTFLSGSGWILYAVKSRSIDATKKPYSIYEQEIATLEARGYRVRESIDLSPYELDHAMVVAQKAGA